MIFFVLFFFLLLLFVLFVFFFFNDTATTEIYTLSLHDALPISLGVSGFHRFFAAMTGRPALIERFCRPDGRDIGCWAITEPDHGSDQLVVADGACDLRGMRPNCTARRDGNTWVIDGQKAAWVSNGTIATVATLFCTVDPSQGLRGGGVALVPLDLPGVSRG